MNLKFTCCICGKQFEGYGNNPAPVKSEGECCDNCNFSVVLPARILGIKKMKESAGGKE